MQAEERRPYLTAAQDAALAALGGESREARGLHEKQMARALERLGLLGVTYRDAAGNVVTFREFLLGWTLEAEQRTRYHLTPEGRAYLAYTERQ